LKNELLITEFIFASHNFEIFRVDYFSRKPTILHVFVI